LTLVANSFYAELESCEVRAASLGNGGSVRPGSDAQQVDGCCGDDMLQVGFGKSAIASAALPSEELELSDEMMVNLARVVAAIDRKGRMLRNRNRLR